MATLPDTKETSTAPVEQFSKPPLLRRNRSFLLLGSGETISILGDAFFNLAVLWLVYIQSGSILQTALIQVVWHLDGVLFGPLAGVLADRWDRKRIMVWTNLCSALTVGALAAIFSTRGPLPSLAVFGTVFLLNSLATFSAPAASSLMPELVAREQLTTAMGTFSSAAQLATLLGNMLAGVVLAVGGTTWVLLIDMFSFFYAALASGIGRFPVRKTMPERTEQGPRFSLLRELIDGWRALKGLPTVWRLIWLGVLLNFASFMGPLYPALVQKQLHGGAFLFGLLEVAGVIGGIVAGLLVGLLEKKLGAGRLVLIGWSTMGLTTLGIAFSTLASLTLLLGALQACSLIISSTCVGSLRQILILPEYRGRAAGIIRSLSIISIPVSALLGGWLADLWGVTPLFASGGLWILAISLFAWSSRQIRTARIERQPAQGNGTL